MLNSEQQFRQMMALNRVAFENVFNLAVVFQEQAEKAADIVMDQVTWLPKDKKGQIDEWSSVVKKGNSDFKSYMDTRFENMEQFVLDYMITPLNSFTQSVKPEEHPVKAPASEGKKK